MLTFKVQLSFTVEGVTEKALSPTLSIKATQSAVKAKLANTKRTVYQSGGSERSYMSAVSITSPTFATINTITVNSATTK